MAPPPTASKEAAQTSRSAMAAQQAIAQAQAQSSLHVYAQEEMSRWLKRAEAKDKALKVAKKVPVSQKQLPPVRSQASNAADSGTSTKSPSSATSVASGNASEDATDSTKTTAASQSKAANRISSYDYRGWDRFDVDKELAKLEEGEKQQEPSSNTGDADAVTDGAGSEEQFDLQSHIALVEKEKGNDQFKQGKYVAAAECYTRGLEADPSSATLYANRAMAYLKVKRYAECIQDCTNCLQLDKDYVKAYQRRAKAYHDSGNLADAIQDLQAILALQPKNKQAKQDLAKYRQELERQKKEQHKEFNPLTAAMELRKQQHQGSASTSRSNTSGMKRIRIEEIGTPYNSDEEAEEEPLRVHKSSAARDAMSSERAAAASDAHGKRKIEIQEVEQVVESISSASDNNRSTASVEATNSLKEQTSLSSQNLAASGRTSEDASISTASAASTSKAQSDKRQSISSTKLESSSKAGPVSSTQAETATRNAAAAKIPEEPTTSFLFQRDWRALHKDASRVAAYLQQIAPKRLAGLIRHSLDASMFTTMVRAMRLHYLPAGIAAGPVLKALAKTPRFDTVLLFLEKDERQELDALLSDMRENEEKDADEIARLFV